MNIRKFAKIILWGVEPIGFIGAALGLTGLWAPAATGAILGGGVSALTGGNVLQGAALGGLTGGIGGELAGPAAAPVSSSYDLGSASLTQQGINAALSGGLPPAAAADTSGLISSALDTAIPGSSAAGAAALGAGGGGISGGIGGGAVGGATPTFTPSTTSSFTPASATGGSGSATGGVPTGGAASTFTPPPSASTPIVGGSPAAAGTSPYAAGGSEMTIDPVTGQPIISTAQTPSTLTGQAISQATAPAPPTGGTSAPGFLSKLASGAAKNIVPLALMGLSSGQKPVDYSVQLRALGAPAEQLSNKLLAQYQSGQLNPSDQYSIAQWQQNQKAAVKNYYAQAGLSDSSMAQQALAQVDVQANAMRDQALQNMAQAGLSAAGVAAGPMTNAVTSQIQQDQRAQEAQQKFLQTLAMMNMQQPAPQ